MKKVSYWEFFGFENVYLEDSYVIQIHTKPLLEIVIEAVITENNVHYTNPKKGEQYCYKKMKIQFPAESTYKWIENNIQPIIDPDGSIDFGNIDSFFKEGDSYYMEGEWGKLKIISETTKLVSCED